MSKVHLFWFLIKMRKPTIPDGTIDNQQFHSPKDGYLWCEIVQLWGTEEESINHGRCSPSSRYEETQKTKLFAIWAKFNESVGEKMRNDENVQRFGPVIWNGAPPTPLGCDWVFEPIWLNFVVNRNLGRRIYKKICWVIRTSTHTTEPAWDRNCRKRLARKGISRRFHQTLEENYMRTERYKWPAHTTISQNNPWRTWHVCGTKERRKS